MGEGFIHNHEWARRFLTDGEENEIRADFHHQQRQRREHAKKSETGEARKQHLLEQHASTQQEAKAIQTLRKELTEYNSKKVYQLRGTAKTDFAPKHPGKPPPPADQIVNLLQNVYQAGRTSKIVGGKLLGGMREQQMLDLMPRDGQMGISKPMCLVSCPLVAADVSFNQRLEAINRQHADRFNCNSAQSGTVSSREVKKFTSLAKFLEGDSQLAARYGLSEAKMKASLSRLKSDPKLLTCLKTIKQRATNLKSHR